MILFCLMCLALAIIVYACTSRIRTRSRLLASILAFLIPVLTMTAALIIVGDRIPPDAVNVDAALDDGS